MKIVTLCTGNVARSVMLAYMLTTLAESHGYRWQIRSAGTHVVEGSAISARTRDALVQLEDLGEHNFNAHRSRQLTARDVAWADVILASEAHHVNFVRRNYPEAASKSVVLHQFVIEAPLEVPFEEQLGAVVAQDPSGAFDIVDPAGGDQGAYEVCASQLWDVAQLFCRIVGASEQE